MGRFNRYLLVLTTTIIFAGSIPQAGAQVVVQIGHGHRHHHRHHHRYHRHGRR